MIADMLMDEAKRAMLMAYAPYSGYKVGAALLTESGRVYTGCNVESAAFSPTCCAERTAFYKAISEGERDFSAIAVIGGKNAVVTMPFVPCGVCRQVIREFCDWDFKIHIGTGDGKIITKTLGELFPMGFGPDYIK